MNDTLVQPWWLLAWRGAVYIGFGALAILWPAITLLTLTALFAGFALLAGAVWLFGAVRYRQRERRWWLMALFGLFSLLCGTLAALYPALTTLALIVLMGANALVTGVFDILVALRMRKRVAGKLLLLLTGLVSILFGALVLLFPLGAGALALAWMAGLYAMLAGAMMLTLAWQLRSRESLAAPPTGA